MAEGANKHHISKNRLQGSLSDAPVPRLLEACHKHLVTARIEVKANGKTGVIEVRAGAVENANFDGQDGKAAVGAMSELAAGDYELRQQLPDLEGNLGDSASFEGDTKDMGLVKVLRHCEDNALSCIITVAIGSDEAVVHYRVGELEKFLWNGVRDDDKLFEIMQVKDARFRVTAPPLDLEIDGWPSLEREPTAPFKIVKPADIDAPPPPARVAEATPRPAVSPAAQAAVAAVAAAPAAAPAEVQPSPKTKSKNKKKKGKQQQQVQPAEKAEANEEARADNTPAKGKEAKGQNRKKAGTGSSVLPPMQERFVRPSKPPVHAEAPAKTRFSTSAIIITLLALGGLWAFILLKVLGD